MLRVLETTSRGVSVLVKAVMVVVAVARPVRAISEAAMTAAPTDARAAEAAAEEAATRAEAAVPTVTAVVPPQVLNLSMVRPLWRWASRAALLKFSPLKVWPLSPLSLSISSRASLSLFLTYEGRQRARGGMMMIAQLAKRDQGGGLALLCTLT